MNDLRVTDCINCLKVTNHVIPQPANIIDGSPKTLGGLADYNRKHMGSVHYQEKVQQMANERKQLTKYCGVVPEGGELCDKSSFKETPWAKDTLPVEKINKMTGQQKKDYVLTGKTPLGI